MAITDFASLKSTAASWLERDIDDAVVSMAESWLKRQLTGYQREVIATLVTDAGGYATLPADFVGIRSVFWGAQPFKYSISGNSLYIKNGAGRSFAVTYYGSLPGLSDANPTNWLLLQAPDVYLYALLAQASAFAQDWQNAAIYEAKATEFLDQLNLQSTVAQYGRAGLVVNGGLAP